jgi:hypothetical protein
LTHDLIIQEAGLLQLMNQTNLTQDNDSPRWKWAKNGSFTVKLVYKQICGCGRDRSFRHLWKRKIPLKIKIWLWLIWHNAIATKGNLLKPIGLGTQFANFAVNRKPSIISSLVVQRPNLFGVQWLLISTLPSALGVFHNSFGGFPNLFLPVVILR